MQTRTMKVSAISPANVEEVWALIADVMTWSEWAKLEQMAALGQTRPCSSDPERLSPRVSEHPRRFRRGRYNNTQEVVRFQPPHAFSYEIRAGNLPVHDYHSDIELKRLPEGGTSIAWSSRFNARWPLAPIIERGLQTFISDSVHRLATAAHADGRIR